MAEIFSAFGVDAKLIVIQIFNFGLLLFALWYFLYTPVLKMLHDRQTTIEKGVRDAEKAENSLKEAEETKNTIVADAHKEASEIVARGESHGALREKEIIAEAETRGSAILERANVLGKEEQDRLKKEAEEEVAKAAVLAAEKILRNNR